MYNIIKNVFFVAIFFTFLFLITKYYFSEKNKILTNKSRSSYELILNNGKKDLPVLKNDTNNVIVYVKDLENYKKKRKKRFWEKLISNDN